MSYAVHFRKNPDLSAPFDAPDWAAAPVLHVNVLRPESSDHCPRVDFKLQYDRDGLYGLFAVEDRFVKCTARNFQDSTCIDSCMEFFVQPCAGSGYTNFEFSAAGVLLAQHIDNHRRSGAGGFAQSRSITREELGDLRIFHTFNGPMDQEIPGPLAYRVGFFIPFTLFKKVNNAPIPVPGMVWHANVYKCADHSSHPHWLSWMPVRRLAFHEPDCFGTLLFL